MLFNLHRYIMIYEILTGQSFEQHLQKPELTINDAVTQYFQHIKSN